MHRKSNLLFVLLMEIHIKNYPQKFWRYQPDLPLLPKWLKTANPFYEFGSRCISVSFISFDTDRTSTPCVCLYWNSVSLTLPPSCTVSRNLWILEFHAFMKCLDFLASKFLWPRSVVSKTSVSKLSPIKEIIMTFKIDVWGYFGPPHLF